MIISPSLINVIILPSHSPTLQTHVFLLLLFYIFFFSVHQVMKLLSTELQNPNSFVDPRCACVRVLVSVRSVFEHCAFLPLDWSLFPKNLPVPSPSVCLSTCASRNKKPLIFPILCTNSEKLVVSCFSTLIWGRDIEKTSQYSLFFHFCFILEQEWMSGHGDTPLWFQEVLHRLFLVLYIKYLKGPIAQFNWICCPSLRGQQAPITAN